MTSTLNKITESIKNWWIYLVYGILLIAFSIWIFMTPVESYVGLSIAFSIMVFVSGISNIYFSVTNRKKLESWGWYLANGIFELIIGMVLILYPEISIVALPFIVGFWLMFKSVFLMGFALELRKYLYLDWGLMFFFGAIIGLLSFFILINPLFGAVTVVSLTGIALLLFGIGNIILAFKLKKLKAITYDKVDELKTRIKKEAEVLKKELQIKLDKAGEKSAEIKEEIGVQVVEFVYNLLNEKPPKKK